MAATINNIFLAYLLALQEFTESLTQQQKTELAIVNKVLEQTPRPSNWQAKVEHYIEKAVQGNKQLNQSYETYKTKLAQVGEKTFDLGSLNQEIQAFIVNDSATKTRPIPIRPDGRSDYGMGLENAVKLVNKLESPQKTLKQLDSIKKVQEQVNQASS